MAVTNYHKVLAENLANPSLVRVKKDFSTQKIETRWLGVLVLESLLKHKSDPDTFGQSATSFDRALKPVFDRIERSPLGRESRDKLITEYKKIRPLTPHIDRIPVADYLKTKGEEAVEACIRDMRAHRLIPPSLDLPSPSQNVPVLCRSLKTTLVNIKCIAREDVLSDTPYVITAGSLSDFTGTWMQDTECSEYSSDVGPGDYVDLEPPSIRNVFDWYIQNPSAAQLAPVAALCTITLMEKDNGDRERVYEAFNAAYSAAKLIIEIAQGAVGGPIGVAFAVATILISVILALDGDDELGTVSLLFEDVLSGSAPQFVTINESIKGSHLSNDYEYSIRLQFSYDDEECPVEPPFKISGKDRHTIPQMGGSARGTYKIACPAPIDQITWKVAPSEGVRVMQQGSRSTSIQWRRDGNFVVTATARSPSGEHRYSDQFSVAVAMGGGGPPL